MKTESEKREAKRLNALIGLFYGRGSIDFEQMLFFARKKTKTENAAVRKALDQWIRDGRD
jgi:hypothetical protein